MSLVVGRHSPGRVVCWAVVVFSVTSAALCLLLQYGVGDVTANKLLHDDNLQELILKYPALYERAVRNSSGGTQDWAIVLAVFLTALLLAATFVIWTHEPNTIQLTFRVPLVPLVPLASIFANMAFMVHLNPMTWVRFTVWMAAGLLLYFCYGMHHSRETVPISSYTTLLPPGDGGGAASADAATTTAAVVSSLQSTLSQVTSKIASLPPSLKGARPSGYGGVDAGGDDVPILGQEEAPAQKEDGV